MAIPYLNGYTIKPAKINSLGIVEFTDGTNSVTPNEQQCQAYGYTYDKTTGTCRAFNSNTNLERNVANVNNNIQGAGNVTGTGTNNTYIMGEDNTVRGFSANNIIIGTNNVIDNGINNAFVYGHFGEVTTSNTIVLGGNAAADNLGERQSIRLMYGTQTTAGTTTNSFLNNTTDSFFVIPRNAICYFHADVIAVRVGGTGEGSVGDYASWVERGVVINKSGTLSVQRERDVIKTSGSVSNWRPAANVTGTNFRITVRGDADQTIEWNSNITFTQIKTGVTL